MAKKRKKAQRKKRLTSEAPLEPIATSNNEKPGNAGEDSATILRPIANNNTEKPNNAGEDSATPPQPIADNNTEKPDSAGEDSAVDQADSSRRLPIFPCFRRGTFWGIVIGIASLVATIVVPLYLDHRAEQKLISLLEHQLVVKPVAGTKTADGYSRWIVFLIVSNRGPAAVKTSVTTMQFPHIKTHLVSPPIIVDKPIGGEVEVDADMRNGWVQVAAKNMTHPNVFVMEAELAITQSERRILMELWESNPFDSELVKKLIYFVSTKGEDVVAEYGGAYPIPRWIGE
jgi:hypothetical protein